MCAHVAPAAAARRVFAGKAIATCGDAIKLMSLAKKRADDGKDSYFSDLLTEVRKNQDRDRVLYLQALAEAIDASSNGQTTFAQVQHTFSQISAGFLSEMGTEPDEDPWLKVALKPSTSTKA
jgi:hypothetical protein